MKDLWPRPRIERVKKYKVKIEEPIVLAGPCFVDDYIEDIVLALNDENLTYLRGGVFKAGTYPPANFGLQKRLLRKMRECADNFNLKILNEILDIRDLDFMLKYSDALQIGARHMQDYAMLKELSKLKMDIFIKRGVGQNLYELLGAVEYLLSEKCRPHIVERGSATFQP